MQTPTRLSTIALALTVMWAAPTFGQATGVAAPANAQTANAPVFSAQEIDAMLAPIALYPDALLSQVLMAATYPLEIVQAARWSTSTGNKGGDVALSKVSDQTWDPSVQSLVAFPQVLTMMSDQLDWTQKLGDAFLAQQRDVMDAVQRLRLQAQKAGNLNSNTQQKVIVQDQTVIIEPAQPSVIYVPAYNPTVVYGTWAYPSYPPVYYPGVMSWYPGQAVVSGLMWGAGVAAAGAIFGGFNWNNRDVNINVNNFNRIGRNNNFYGGQGNNNWKHNPQHRGAVAYRDNGSRQQYSTRDMNAVNARNDLRGHGATPGANRVPGNAQTRPGANAAAPARNLDQNRAAPQRDAMQNRAAPQREAVQNRPAPQREAMQNRAAQPTARSDAFRGVDAGRQQIDRGRASAAAASRPNAGQGGGGRGGGGGGGGGMRGQGRG